MSASGGVHGFAGVTIAAGRWRLGDKRYFEHRGAQLSAVAYHAGTSMMVAALSSGVFELYQVGIVRAPVSASMPSARVLRGALFSYVGTLSMKVAAWQAPTNSAGWCPSSADEECFPDPDP